MDEKNIQEELIDENIEETNLIDENEKKIYLLDVQIQELSIELERLEEQLLVAESEEIENKYYEVKNQYHELVKEKKILVKQIRRSDTSKLNQVAVWIIIFGIITVIISLPFISTQLWFDFVDLISNLLTGKFANLDKDGLLYKIIIFIIIFAFPLLLNIIVWEVYVNLVKTKINKKVFIGFWIVQGLMNLGMIIYMCFQLYGA